MIGRIGQESGGGNVEKRDLWLGLGAVAGSVVGHLIRRAFGKGEGTSKKGGAKTGLVRASIGGPGSVMAATGLSRSAAIVPSRAARARSSPCSLGTRAE